jgi:hypothetical protein
MTIKIRNFVQKDRITAQRFRLAFFLLALGDTGHVGFRVMAYFSGGLDSNATLVGLGALSTSITITFFYIILYEICRINFIKKKDYSYYLVMLLGLIRLIIMIFPQNQWGSSLPPLEWVLLRNLPLIIIGFGVVFLMLRNGYKENDYPYRYIGYGIIVSFAFYLPVIFLVQLIPIIGMLMIPKTIAYMFMAWVAYRYYFTENFT